MGGKGRLLIGGEGYALQGGEEGICVVDGQAGVGDEVFPVLVVEIFQVGNRDVLLVFLFVVVFVIFGNGCWLLLACFADNLLVHLD